MERTKSFTYTRASKELRNKVFTLFLVLLFDVPVHIALAFIREPWDRVAGLSLLTLELFFIWAITRILRTKHLMGDAKLGLRFGLAMKADIPLENIAGAEPYAGRIPFLSMFPEPVQEDDSDTLFLLASEKLRANMVRVTLREGCEPTLLRKKPPVRHLVLSVDQPEEFLACFRSSPTPMETDAVPKIQVDAPSSRYERVIRMSGEKVAVEIENLVKRYGNFEAVKGISLSVRQGEIIGFLGSNGAGKTTTIRMMTGQLRPTSGDIRIEGHSVLTDRQQALRQLGYVPDVPVLYEGLTARQMLWFVGGLYGMSREESRARGEELLETFGLLPHADRMVGTYSLGMKRKISIAAGLMHRPPILVLDEVTNGLDPKAAREVKDRIAQQADQGVTVFLTTHILDIVEELADRIAIVDRGSLLAVGTLDELREEIGNPQANVETVFLEVTRRAQGEAVRS